MSKSIFLIDTPKCCGMCPMSGTDVCRKWNMKDLRTFPEDCPLIKVPEYKGQSIEHVNTVDMLRHMEYINTLNMLKRKYCINEVTDIHIY